MVKRIAVLIALFTLILAPNLSACEWWMCADLPEGHKQCQMRFDGGIADTWAGFCHQMCDCPTPDTCGCWCSYSGMCFQV
jgi:hypothetical protein